MSEFREDLNTILQDAERATNERIAIRICKFVYGRRGCKCDIENKTPCESLMGEARSIYSIVEDDVKAHAAAKKQASNEKAQRTRSRKKYIKKVMGDSK
jgi:hypothetical protein